jgi:hypothetical protein
MKTLTTQNLKFIDNYLKKSEIIYDDIRMELTDHIASAVEEKMKLESIDFYDAFKIYMISNKKELLKKISGSGFKSFEPIKSFGLFLLKPINLPLGIVFIFIFHYFQNIIDKANFVLSFNYHWMAFIILFGLSHQIFFGLIKKKRFFMVEQSMWILFLFQQILNLFANPRQIDNVIHFYINYFFIYITIMFLLFYVNRIKKYYNNKHIWN